MALAVGIGAASAVAADAPGGAQLANGCTSCHGVEGRGVSSIPALAGRTAADLLAALHGFRDQTRDATIMNRIARGYSDAELQALADYFSSIK